MRPEVGAVKLVFDNDDYANNNGNNKNVKHINLPIFIFALIILVFGK